MDSSEAVSLPELSPVRGKKYFTIEDANRALALVGRIVTDIVREYEKLHRLRDTCRALDARGETTAAEEARQRYMALTDQLTGLKEEVEQVGCDLKDFRVGLVDFPAWLDGREVCLCWQLGEDSITHWHEVTDGFAGRQPVNDIDFDLPRGKS